MIRSIIAAGVWAMAVVGSAVQARSEAGAQDWPNRPIRFVVGVQPGGTNDAIARIIAKVVSENVGQSIVVENRPGASGNIGTEYVLRSPPDGYTYYVPTSSIAIRPALFTQLSFDFIADFEHVGLLAKVPNIISVNPAVPASNLKELVELSKQKAGYVTYGSGSVGSSGHVTGESMKLLTGADVRHVAYKGVAGALNDVRAGHIKAIVDNLPSSVPLIRDGSLKPIAVTSSKRSLLLPEVPTVAESGVPGFEMVAWFGLIAPKGTPKAIVERMNAEISKALANPEVIAKYNRDGFQAEAMKPDEFRAYVVDETKKWGELVRKAGITLQ